MKKTFSENRKGELLWMTADGLSEFPELTHAFTARYGGVSSGIYSSLNLGFTRGDAPELVCENYRILCSALDINEKDLVVSHQIHSDIVRRASDEDRKAELSDPCGYDADALITNEPGMPLVIYIADCIPILLYAPDVKAIGAVHAGWRGTVADIAGKTVKALCEQYGAKPENILAVIGEGIGMCCFETGPEVFEAVKALEPENLSELAKKTGNDKYHIDLKGLNKTMLMRSGLKENNIAVSSECTKCLSEKYWSHRATNGERGVQAAIITLKK